MNDFHEETPHRFTLRLSLPVPERVFEKLDQGHRQKRRCPMMKTPAVPVFLRQLRDANDDAAGEMQRTVHSDLWEIHLRHVIEYHTVLSDDSLAFYVKSATPPAAPEPVFTVKFVRKDFLFEFAELDMAFLMYTFMRNFKFYRDAELLVEPQSQLLPLIACLQAQEPELDYDSDGCEIPARSLGLFSVTQDSQLDFYHTHFRIGSHIEICNRRSRLESLREQIDAELAKLEAEDHEHMQIKQQLDARREQ
jgi:hypothetical protein